MVNRLWKLYAGLGLAAAIAAVVIGEDSHRPAAAGVACGLGICAGLCMVASAIVAVGMPSPPRPPRPPRDI